MSLGKLGRWSLALIAVLLLSYSPARAASVGNTVSSLDSLSIFAGLAEESGLISTLNQSGPYTVFAPTDAAFLKLPPGTLERLRRPENRAILLATLEYHVVPGKVGFSDMQDETSEETTLEGGNISVEAGEIWVGIEKPGQDLARADGDEFIELGPTAVAEFEAIGDQAVAAWIEENKGKFDAAAMVKKAQGLLAKYSN